MTDRLSIPDITEPPPPDPRAIEEKREELAKFLGRNCDTVGCTEFITPASEPDEWQILEEEVGLVLCDEHRVCEACYGDGYFLWGDREVPCSECFDPYPEY